MRGLLVFSAACTYGNAQNVPLGDAGLDASAKFNNSQLADLYVFGSLARDGGMPAEFKTGRQVLHWGASCTFCGGINVMNRTELASIGRPGTLPEDSRASIGMLHG